MVILSTTFDWKQKAIFFGREIKKKFNCFIWNKETAITWLPLFASLRWWILWEMVIKFNSVWFDKISGEWNDLSYRQMRNSGEIYLHTKIPINNLWLKIWWNLKWKMMLLEFIRSTSRTSIFKSFHKTWIPMNQKDIYTLIWIMCFCFCFLNRSQV